MGATSFEVDGAFETPDPRVARGARNPGLEGSIPSGLADESRRDSATKPKVARNELPWVTSGRIESTPKELCHLAI